VAVADVFDALTSARSYKTAWTPAAAAEEIEAQRGRQFDPRVVDAFLAVLAQHSAPPCAQQSSDALITLMDELALESEARRAA
jgi:HD-GYP domain-containing protein (c-di-GMP phosphodiesterase class II)